MLVNVTRDAPLVPAMERPVQVYLALLEQMHSTLMSGRPEPGRARRRVAAATQLALSFETWRSLTREGNVSDGEAVTLMTGAVEAAAADRQGV